MSRHIHLSTYGNTAAVQDLNLCQYFARYLKKVITIFSLFVFSFISIIMPYANFDDNYATQLLYNEQQNADPDLTLSEFVFGKLLHIGDLITGESDMPASQSPLKDAQPLQALQIQAGSIEYPKQALKILPVQEKTDKPTCLFKENKFAREFSSSVFHPPLV